MNQAVEKFKTEAAKAGCFTPEEICDTVREMAKEVIKQKYKRDYWKLKDEMDKMSYEELKAIVAETEEGGKQ